MWWCREQEHRTVLHPVCLEQSVSGEARLTGIRGVVRPGNRELPKNRAIPGRNGPFKASFGGEKAGCSYMLKFEALNDGLFRVSLGKSHGNGIKDVIDSAAHTRGHGYD